MNAGAVRRPQRGRDSEGVDLSGGTVRERIDPWTVWAIAVGDEMPVRIYDARDEADALAHLPRTMPAVVAEGERIACASGHVTSAQAQAFVRRIEAGVIRCGARPVCEVRRCGNHAARTRADTPAWARGLCARCRAQVSERVVAGRRGPTADIVAAELRGEGKRRYVRDA